MTRQQYDNVVNKMHVLIEKQGCVCIKAVFDKAKFDRFYQEAGITYNVDYEASGDFNGGDVYVYSLLTDRQGSRSIYEIANDASYIISEIGYYQPKKIEVF